MPEPVLEGPARRFLHVCYCCADDREVAAFLAGGLDLVPVMRTTDQYSAGEVLGLTGEIRTVGHFVYDRRGPRTSPAVEVQGWYDPLPVGEPSTDPFEVGIRALGIGVPSVASAVERLRSMGCMLVAEGRSPSGEGTAVVLDPRRVTLDLIEDTTLEAGASRLRHLRVTASNLEQSISFYAALGFAVLERLPIVDGTFLGIAGAPRGHLARLRLPDEPFELVLVGWDDPPSHGRHYAEANHAGIFRAALAVDDTRASYEQLSARGAVFDRPPMAVAMDGTDVPDLWITFLSDPDGIPIELVQRPRSIFRDAR